MTDNFTKNFLNSNFIKILGALVLIFTFLDFLLKWKIFLYLQYVAAFLFINLLSLINNFPFEIITSIYLVIITALSLNSLKKIEGTKSSELEKQLIDIKGQLEEQKRKNAADLATQVKSVTNQLDRKIFDIEYRMVELEIESFRNKKQVGELSMLIKKLEMDKKRGWGIEDTLFEIKEYIKENGMPNYYFEDLNRTLEGVLDSFKGIKEDIRELAKEKFYKVR